jgi:hypothetical protein
MAVPGPLGRRPPTDFRHVEKYPMRLLSASVQEGAGGVFGINWWSAFDDPKRIGRKDIVGVDEQGRVLSNLGYIRGGHAIDGRVHGVVDSVSWWEFYDQGLEWEGKPDKDYSSCVGQAIARYATNKNRSRYDAYELYHAAQEIDEWDGVDYEGTSVRAGFEVMRTRGPVRVWGDEEYPASLAHGIEAYFWAENVDQIRRALKVPDSSSLIPALNSWGKGYPHIVYFPDDVIDRVVFREDGEFGIATDRVLVID